MRSILVLCSVWTAWTGSVLVLFQPQWVNAPHLLWLRCDCMNGFLQWPYRVSFFSPSSEADIQGGSPGSRQPKCFSIPLVGMDISGAVLMRLKQNNMAVSSDRRWEWQGQQWKQTWFILPSPCSTQEKENIQASGRLISKTLDLFVFGIICRLGHFPKNLKYSCLLQPHWPAL